jgi:hypothetical protein
MDRGRKVRCASHGDKKDRPGTRAYVYCPDTLIISIGNLASTYIPESGAMDGGGKAECNKL